MDGSSAADEAVLAVPRGAGMAPFKDNERTLTRAAQRGSADAIEELIRRHWPGAVRMAYVIIRNGASAEDVAQDAMLAAIQSLDRFDRRRPFAPWLHRIVINKALDRLRAEARRGEVPLSGSEDQSTDPEPGPLSEELAQALEGLTPQDRAIVAMNHLFGYSAKEIGIALEMKPGTVRSRLSRALAQLRRSLDPPEGEGARSG
jgi:RNA polymerase sigma-70 factor, ECF subfamily